MLGQTMQREEVKARRAWRPPFKGGRKTGMNKLEQRYADYLEIHKQAGQIASYKYERIKLKLADNTFYTPDFQVVTLDHIAFHEVKGFMRDDAAVKLKVAAEMYPEYQFVLVTWAKKTGWVVEEV